MTDKRKISVYQCPLLIFAMILFSNIPGNNWILLQILVYNIERVFHLTFVGYLSCSLFIYLGNFPLNNTDQIWYKPKCESVSYYFV